MRKSLALAAAALAAIELVSLVVASIGEGGLVLWSGWQARRAAVVERFAPEQRETSGDPATGSSQQDVIHPYLGFVGDASRSATVNEYGFPGRQNPITRRSPDRLIVGLLGGSPAVDLAANGREVLERALGREVLLVCLAHAEYKQPQQLMALSYMLALGAEFDLVINIDGFNEVALHEAGNAFKRVFPIYPANWYLYTSSAPDPDLRRLIGRQAWIEQEMLERARRYSRAPWRYSLTLNALWSWRQRASSKLHATLGESMRTFATQETEKLPYWVQGPPLDLEKKAELYDLLVSAWRNGSLQLSRLANENGMRYLHVLQPDPRVTDGGLLDAVYEPGIRTGYPMLVEAGRELAGRGVRLIDLSNESGRLYRDGCCRLTPEGIELLAGRIGLAVAVE